MIVRDAGRVEELITTVLAFPASRVSLLIEIDLLPFETI